MAGGSQIFLSPLSKKWDRAKRALKYESRYFNEPIKDVLHAIFMLIEDCVERDRHSAIWELSPKNANYSIFRARCFNSMEEAKKAWKKPEREFGPPPAEKSTSGRMNAVGIPVFYGATTRRLAVSEIRPPVGCCVAVAQFEVVQSIKLLDIKRLWEINRDIIASENEDRVNKNLLYLSDFLFELNDELTRVIVPKNQSIEYVVTQAISEYASNYNNLDIHGLAYDSSQANKVEIDTNGSMLVEKNIALFNKFSSIRSGISSISKSADDQNEKLQLNNKNSEIYTITGTNFSTNPKLSDDNQ